MAKVLRSKRLAKTISYRILGTLITFVVAYVYTQQLELAGIIMSADFALKTNAYYMHEKVWEKV